MSLNKFIRVCDNLVQFDALLNDKQLPISSTYSIETHKDELKSIWEKLKLSYDKCLSDISEKEDKDAESNEKIVQAKYQSAYMTYCRCITRLREIVHELSPPQEQPTTSSSFGFKLPPCEIPTFSGDYDSWPTFRDMFQAVCIRNPRLSNVERLFHLNQCTKGEPNDIVQKVPLTNDNFQLAWKNLCSRYENERVLVNIQLKTLFNLPIIKSENPNALKQLQRDMNSCISLLKLYKINVDTWDPIFIFICSKRLPDSTLTLWEQTLADKTKIPKWAELDSFLTNRHQTLESVSELKKVAEHNSLSSKSENNKTNKSKHTNIHAFQNKVSTPKCHLCTNESHLIRKCPSFLKMDQAQRLAEIKKSNMCLNCFSKVHSVKNCTSKYNCYKCNKKHNTLLHKDQNSSQLAPGFNSNQVTSHPTSSNSLQSTLVQENCVVKSCFTTNSKGVLLGTAIVLLCHHGMTHKVRALVDSGSEATFISQKVFQTLKLPYKRTCAQISGLNNTIAASVQKECSIILSSVANQSIRIPVPALVVQQLSGNLPSRFIDPNIISNMPDIQLADPLFYKSSTIDILIGGDLIPSIMLSGIMHQVCGSLMAQETVFGWIMTGPIPFQCSQEQRIIVSNFCEISLDKDISRFWEVEDLPRKNILSHSDKYCEDLYNRTTERNESGRYIVSLPFKESFPEKTPLGQSRSIAMAQYFRNEARLMRSPSLKSQYDAVLEEYISLGHMSRIPSPVDTDSTNHYYLPHHAVIKPESTTTKVRVVFNASADTSNGTSLNDILHTGPVLQKDLTILILRWRLFKFVINGDITKMYRQILINSDHQQYQRILFRKNPTEPIQDYQLKTVTFGVNCAPFLAMRTIEKLADDTEAVYPIASEILRNFMYVDDALVGAHTIESAIESRNQLRLALKCGGFSMRKWTSNCKDILADIPPEDLLFQDFLEFDDRSIAKTLGIQWNARSDCFLFSIKPLLVGKYTKREVLSQISKLFDPAGWLAPCIVVAKIIMQRIWMEKTNWDDEISAESLSQWMSFLSSYKFLKSIEIPRWFNYTPTSQVQFHGFSDASEKAYAAALYIRVSDAGSITTHLISAKTKVAPIKSLSIPRLELCGAHILSELIAAIVPSLRISNYSIFCWTDSTIVLSWLSKPPCVWTTFVANRVSKIIEVTNPSIWRHVRSQSNPADLASRGMSMQDLSTSDLWWHGPQWLREPISNWPQPTEITQPDIEIEMKKIRVNFSYFSKFEDILERFSSFQRALRVVAYVYRFLYRTHPSLRSDGREYSKLISHSEIQKVQTQLQIMTQKAYYPNEYMALSAKKTISSSSSLLNLNPFLDKEGVMRISGRLVASPSLTYNEKHPVILPYNCQYSRLLVAFIHEISLHGGNQLVLRLVRTQHWIPKVKNLIKSTINKCKQCLLFKRRCQSQMMSALPPERTEISRPFAHTGLDFAGPFEIKNYTGRACLITKGYVCVFVCFSTKALHLEATSDLSTPAFLAAFSRFVSRRGCPLHLHSDNGTTFVGASKVLAKEFIQSSREAVSANYAHQNISWHFIPPGAPHMGGLWEAGVKSFKQHFKKMAGNFKYTFEEFQSLLARIEACLNSRPISAMSEDPSDLNALTPGHFLIGTPILVPIDSNTNEAPISITNRWQRVKVIYSHFCLRWKNEYLKELHKRHKWQIPVRNLAESDMVVIKDENLPPNCWRLGRVSKIYPGSDGRIRVVDVLTQRGTITRPITKLVFLPYASTTSPS